MYSYLCLLVLLLPLTTAQAPGDRDPSCPLGGDASTVVIFDSNHYTSLIPPWRSINNGDIAEWAEIGTDDCMGTVGICNTNDSSLGDILFTQYVDATVPSRVSVVVDYAPHICPEGQTCTDNADFNLHIRHSSTPGMAFTSVDGFVPLSGITSGTPVSVTLIEDGFYLAFESNPSCVEISRVQATYTQCPGTVNQFVRYPPVLNGVSGSGMCVENAEIVEGTSLNIDCALDATAFDFSSAGSCECIAGFGANTDECVECTEGTFKQSAGDAMCMPCPLNSDSSGVSLRTQCNCLEGHERADPVDVTLPCSMCVDNYFMSGGVCTACPAGSTSSGGVVTDCTCGEGLVTADGSSSTSSAACDLCAENYFQATAGTCTACPAGSTSPRGTMADCTCDAGLVTNSGSSSTSSVECDRCAENYFRPSPGAMCLVCPTGGSRTLTADEGLCVCDNNRATSENSPNTTSLACVGCTDGYFNNQTAAGTSPPLCVSCPTNSMSTGYDDTTCQCNMGSQLDDGSRVTTFQPCSSCSPGNFRPIADGACISCPENSNRGAATDDESMCTCVENFRRRPMYDPEDGCLPVIGFVSNETVLLEGSEEGIALRLSAMSPNLLEIPIEMDPSFNYVTVDTDVEVAPNTLDIVVAVMVEDDDIALEESTVFELRITVSSPLFVLGGQVSMGMLFERTSVTIQDNDVVQVGFTQSSLAFNESEGDPSFTVVRLQPIATNLMLTIMGVESPVEIENPTVMLTIESDSMDVKFKIITDNVGGQEDRVIVLELVYNGDFQDSVVIGGGDTSSTLRITIHDDDAAPVTTPLGLGAIIGIACAGAGFFVLLLLIVVLCLCICRLRVNRQGFYHTYEDKTSEPPTMLRYSASLRSISSQTVMPAEGRSAPKENEFYV